MILTRALRSHITTSASTRTMTSIASEPELIVSQEGSVGLLTLNRPKALHSLTENMCKIVIPALDKWSNDPSVNCVVYQSSPRGGKAFCAGGDVRAAYDSGIAPGSKAGHGIPGELTADFFRTEYVMNYAIAQFPKPQVALWDGIVMGGGVGLTAHGRFRVATERTMFAMPETGIGLFPDVGMTYVLPQLAPTTPFEGSGSGAVATQGAIGLFLGLTGTRLLGTLDLCFSGLATHGVDSAQVGDLVNALAGMEPTEHSYTKVGAALDFFSAEKASTGASEKAAILAPNMPAIARCFGPHHSSMESIVSAVTAEASSGEASHAAWATQTLKLLNKASPTSLKVTLKLLRDHAGADVTLAQALENEYTVSQRCMRPGGGGQSDFYEGIRAVLVDKGVPPACWAPKTLEEVTSGAVEDFFCPLETTYRLHLKP